VSGRRGGGKRSCASLTLADALPETTGEKKKVAYVGNETEGKSNARKREAVGDKGRQRNSCDGEKVGRDDRIAPIHLKRSVS